MNLNLLYTLREYIAERNIAPSKVTIACKNFYGTSLENKKRWGTQQNKNFIS